MIQVTAREVQVGQTIRVEFGDYENYIKAKVLGVKEVGANVMVQAANDMFGKLELEFWSGELVEVVG